MIGVRLWISVILKQYSPICHNLPARPDDKYVSQMLKMANYRQAYSVPQPDVDHLAVNHEVCRVVVKDCWLIRCWERIGCPGNQQSRLSDRAISTTIRVSSSTSSARQIICVVLHSIYFCKACQFNFICRQETSDTHMTVLMFSMIRKL